MKVVDCYWNGSSSNTAYYIELFHLPIDWFAQMLVNEYGGGQSQFELALHCPTPPKIGLKVNTINSCMPSNQQPFSLPHCLHYMLISSSSECCYRAGQQCQRLLLNWGTLNMSGSISWDIGHLDVPTEMSPCQIQYHQQSNATAWNPEETTFSTLW